MFFLVFISSFSIWMHCLQYVGSNEILKKCFVLHHANIFALFNSQSLYFDILAHSRLSGRVKMNLLYNRSNNNTCFPIFFHNQILPTSMSCFLGNNCSKVRPGLPHSFIEQWNKSPSTTPTHAPPTHTITHSLFYSYTHTDKQNVHTSID